MGWVEDRMSRDLSLTCFESAAYAGIVSELYGLQSVDWSEDKVGNTTTTRQEGRKAVCPARGEVSDACTMYFVANVSLEGIGRLRQEAASTSRRHLQSQSHSSKVESIWRGGSVRCQ